jgi:hypothetical protein
MYELEVIDGAFAVCKLEKERKIEGKIFFYAVTDGEISLVCKSEDAPKDAVLTEDGWKMMRISGKLDFSLTGVLAKLSGVLADEKIGIFAVSTYDTDYILVKENDLRKAEDCLSRAGYKIKTTKKD